MNALAFDTRRFVKNLTAKGMKPDLADTLGDELTDLMTGRLADMATKTDLELAISRLWNRILALFLTMFVALTAANFALFRFLLSQQFPQ